MAEISIDLRADPAGFESGTKAAEAAMDEWVDAAESGAEDVAEKLEQVIREMVKLGTNSGRTKDEMVRDMRAFGLSVEQAEEAVEAVWREMGDNQRAVQATERAANALGDVQSEAEDTGGKVSELGDITRDVLEGDFGSAAQSAISALEGIGLIAGPIGLAAVAGLTVVTSEITRQQEEADRLRERMASMYRDAIAAGRDYIDEAQIVAEVTDLAFNPDRASEYKKAIEDAGRIGVDTSTWLRAIAGDQDAINAALEVGNQKRDEALRLSKEAGSSESILGDNLSGTSAAIDSTLGQLRERQRLIEENKAAAEQVKEVEKQIGDEAASAERRAKAALEERGRALTEFFNKASKPPSVTVPVRADTGSFEAAMEALRRRRFSVSVGVEYYGLQHRGTFVP